MPRSRADARAAIDKAEKMFRTVPGYAGLGITRVGNDFAVKLNLSTAPGDGVEIPAEIDGVPVKVEIIGDIVALNR